MIEAHVMWDMMTGRSRGYGFVSFRERHDAEQAILHMNGEYLGSRAIRCNWASQKQANSAHRKALVPVSGGGLGGGMPGHPTLGLMPSNSYELIVNQAPSWQTTVYIGNLAPYTSANDLITMCQNFGYIRYLKYQQERGYAFVQYDAHERAAMAITQLGGVNIGGRMLRVGWGKERQHELNGYGPPQPMQGNVVYQNQNYAYGQ